MEIIFNVLLILDGAIYNLVDYIYDIFNFLAGVNIFSTEDYNSIVQRIYVILGLFMLFVLAYSLLKATINPDEFAKGENSFPNLIKNVVISLVIIALLPIVFNVAFNIQNVVLNNDTIPRLILDEERIDETYADAGKRMAYYTFSAFFHPNPIYCTDGLSEQMSDSEAEQCKSDMIETNGGTWYWPPSWFSDKQSLAVVDDQVLNKEASFTNYSQFSKAVADNKINYTPLISTAAGIFLVYVLLNFCFDLAVRVVKLVFYQIIAPIPVICRILPGGNMKDVFSKWVKQVTSIFLEVFIKIAIMNLGVFIVDIMIDNFAYLPGLGALGFVQKMIAQALLIMGVVIFIRQAPKLLSELLHLDTGGMKLGLMDKLAMGGVFAAGGAVGALTSSRGNLFAAGRGFKYGIKNKDFKVIGQESNRRRTQQEALAHGATRRGIMADRVRGAFGFNTRYERNMAEIDARTSLIDDQISLLDNQISDYGIQIDNARRPIQAERLEARRDGNQRFTDLKSRMEDRAKSRLNREDSNFRVRIRFNINGRNIEQSGNLHALRQYVQQHSSTMSAEEITEFNRQIYEWENRHVRNYINAVSAGSINDAVMSNYINDIRSDGVLSQVLMDENGNSQLTDAQRDAIINGLDLWGAIDGGDIYDANGTVVGRYDNINGLASGAQSDINRRMSNINATARNLEHQRQEVQAQRQELQNQKQIIQSEKSTQENARLRYESSASRNNNK